MNIDTHLNNDHLFTLSYEYLILKVCEEYCKLNSINSIEEFNKVNNITNIKTLIYPFFVSYSNGHLDSLERLFGFFYYARGLGYVSIKAVENSFKQGDFSPFFSINYRKTIIADEHQTWDDLKKAVLAKSVRIEDNNYHYKDLFITKDDQESTSLLYNAIDSGLLTMLSLTESKFLNFSEDDLYVNCKHYKTLGLGDFTEQKHIGLKEKRKSMYYSNV